MKTRYKNLLLFKKGSSFLLLFENRVDQKNMAKLDTLLPHWVASGNFPIVAEVN